MVHRSMENLKLDKRLAARRGWVDPNEAETAREALPDVSEKGERISLLSEEPPSGDTGSGNIGSGSPGETE